MDMKIKKNSNDSEGLASVESLNLGAIDEKSGKPVKERLGNVGSAISLFTRLRDDDKPRSINRARIDSMFDGEPPYKASQLRETGQMDKTNLNFGEGQRQLDIATSAYVDFYSSVETLTEVRSNDAPSGERDTKQKIVDEELSTMMRANPMFHSNFMQLCTTFNKHGICPTFFDSPKSWMFQTCLLDDFLFPSESIANEESLDVVIIRKSYALHEVMKFIESEDAATKLGWNLEETKRVVVNNVSSNIEAWNQDKGYQALQAHVKNNDVSFGHTNPKVALLHFLVREMDGSISHYMCAEKTPKDFMFRSLSRYENAGNAYTIFALGVGTNGTYHSVRGLGQRIFAHTQVSNRLRCQMIDGATLAASIMIQPENNRSMEELEFTYYGGMSVLSPNVKVIEKAIPNLGDSVVPALRDMQDQLAANTDTVSPYGPAKASPYRNETQVASDIDVATQISGSAINLFYVSWNRLIKEMVRRILSGKSDSDPMVKEFIKSCERRGVDKTFLKSIDVDRTRAVRAVGGGSAASRTAKLSKLLGVSQNFDEVGRRNLIRDVVSTEVGQEAADRYAPNSGEERQTMDDKIIFFENQQLAQGVAVPVISNEMHGKHIASHIQPLGQIIQALEQGQADPVQAMPMLQTYYQHISEHIQAGMGDSGIEGLIGQAKQVLQITEEAINNTGKHIQKLEREAQEMELQAQAEAQAQAQDPQMQDPQRPPADEANVKMENHQIDMQIKQEKAALDMDIKKREFEQKQNLADAEAAVKLGRQEQQR